MLWFWVERDADRHFSVCLNSRTREVGAEWSLMSEPYVTLDEVAVTLRDAVTPLAAQHGIDVTAALIDLMATPVEKCAPALQRLYKAGNGGVVFRREFYARLGAGGNDADLLEVFGFPEFPEDVGAVVDGLVRLRERRVRGPQPDLLKRARRAVEELGLRWSW